MGAPEPSFERGNNPAFVLSPLSCLGYSMVLSAGPLLNTWRRPRTVHQLLPAQHGSQNRYEFVTRVFCWIISNDIIRVRCTIKRPHSTPCKKAKFKHLRIFPGHCFDFFLPVSGKICHSPIKNVKSQPTFLSILRSLSNSQKIWAEI